MAAIPGKDVLLYVESIPGVWTAICHSTGHTLNINTDLQSAVTKCSGGWAEHLTDGMKDWSVDVDGLEDDAQDITPHDLIGYQIAGLGFRCKIAQTADGTVYYEGNVSVQTSSQNAPADSWVGWTLTLVGNGPLEQKTVGSGSGSGS
jgi:predicted secreted protein